MGRGKETAETRDSRLEYLLLTHFTVAASILHAGVALYTPGLRSVPLQATRTSDPRTSST
eukprot:scaffold36829_cov59-Phaeocystis_antarctica.AAC.1